MGVADLKSKAREAFKRKNYDQAVEIYIAAFEFDANDVDLIEGFHQAALKAREGKGRSLFGGMGKLGMGMSGDAQKKMLSIVRYLAKSPEDKGAWMSFGVAGESGNHWNAAAYAFRVAAKLDPDDNAAWKSLGAALYKQGKIKEASDAYGEAVRIDPKDQDALKMRKNLAAEGALKMSGYETAKSSRDLIKDKDVAGRLERDTRLQMTNEDATDEAARLRADIEKNPATANRTRIRLADVLHQKGDLSGSLAELEKALAADPANYDLSIRIGDLKLATTLADFTKAKAVFEASDTDAARASLEAARSKLLDARLKEFERRVKDHPTDLAERYKLGATYLMASQIDKAIEQFQKTVQDPRRKTDSLLRMAECFEKKNMLDLAAKQVAKAAEDFPELTTDRAKDIAYRLGELHERRGAKDEAKREYMRIFEVDIGFKDVSDRLNALG